ncbi:Inner membrane ABC transporter permease protein YnjC [compost metagenome]
MVASLRHPLGWLVWLAIVAIYAPLFPATVMLLEPALSIAGWQSLFSDPQLPQALLANLVSTAIATVGSLFIALCIVAALWPGKRWQQMNTRLPWLLAVPHVAFATSVLLLFAEGGAFYQLCSACSPLLDRYGIGLGLTLAVKESAFVLWAIYAVLPEKTLAQKMVVLQTLGYSRLQGLLWLVLPTIAPALGAVMLAVIAWSLSVVDVAIILGPGNPPTLAVLAWQWLSQGDADQHIKGTLLCLVLFLLLGAFAAVGVALWKRWRRAIPSVSGQRHEAGPPIVGTALGWLLPLSGLICAVVLLLLAKQSDFDVVPFNASLSFALMSALIALGTVLLWLEWGPSRGTLCLWLPLALPALPLVSGQYSLALSLGFDGSYSAVLWGHLLWVLPWTLLVLQPAWRRLDPRLILIAKTLGMHRGKIFWRIKCPLLMRPILIAFATGFSVSMAQYMPTLWLGAGRFATLTTEAVALSSGGSSAILAGRALWLLALTAAAFALAAGLSRLAGLYRQGLR